MTGMSTFIILTQHTIGSPSQWHNVRKGNKRHIDQKVRKLFLFADDMMVHTENLDLQEKPRTRKRV